MNVGGVFRGVMRKVLAYDNFIADVAVLLVMLFLFARTFKLFDDGIVRRKCMLTLGGSGGIDRLDPTRVGSIFSRRVAG